MNRALEQAIKSEITPFVFVSSTSEFDSERQALNAIPDVQFFNWKDQAAGGTINRRVQEKILGSSLFFGLLGGERGSDCDLTCLLDPFAPQPGFLLNYAKHSRVECEFETAWRLLDHSHISIFFKILPAPGGQEELRSRAKELGIWKDDFQTTGDLKTKALLVFKRWYAYKLQDLHNSVEANTRRETLASTCAVISFGSCLLLGLASFIFPIITGIQLFRYCVIVVFVNAGLLVMRRFDKML